MSHPLFKRPTNRFYALIWVLIIITHFSIFFLLYGFSMEASVTDSLVHNLLFSALGLGIWYLVQYNPLGTNPTRVIINHALSAAISVFLWSNLSKSLLGVMQFDDVNYAEFLADSTIARTLVGFGLYSFFSLSFYLIEYYESLQDRIREELELKSLVNEAQLRSLKNQINPHFLFNSLNSINSLTMVSPEKTRDMVIKLSDFLRYSAGKQNQDHATMEEELRHMNIYLDIEKVRFGKKLQVETHIDEDCLSASIPSFILQPLLENSIKYGVQESLETKPISISCTKSNDFIHIEIKNFFDQDIGIKGEGIGINNIKSRLRLLYGRDGLMKTESNDNLYLVTLDIPCNDEQSKD